MKTIDQIVFEAYQSKDPCPRVQMQIRQLREKLKREIESHVIDRVAAEMMKMNTGNARHSFIDEIRPK